MTDTEMLNIALLSNLENGARKETIAGIAKMLEKIL